MIALEHLQTNALLIVLFGALLTLFTLRVAVYLSQRARVARDLAIIDSLTISKARSNPHRERLERTPHAEPIARACCSDGHALDGAGHALDGAGHALDGAGQPNASLGSVTVASPAGHHPARAAVTDADHDARSQRVHHDPLR